MNRHQIKQYLQNNMWYGENDRYKGRRISRPVSYLLTEPNYSRPWGCDVSGRWDGIVDFSVTKNKGASFVFIKGVDGTVNTPYFAENYNNAVAAGLARSSYGWLYRDANVLCVAQAQAFDTLLNKYPPSPDLPAVIDFEPTLYRQVQSNPNYSDLRKWATEWLRLGNPKSLIYSGKYYMDQYGAMPSDLKDMFAGLWIANYGVSSPGLPVGFSTWKFWQFSATGDALKLAPGNLGKLELDLDYAYSVVTPPLPDPITDGYQKIRRFNSDVYIWRGGMQGKRAHVTNTHGALQTVSSVAKGALVAINGDGWDKTPGVTYHWPLSLTASDGNLYQPVQYDSRPYINIEQDNTPFIDHRSPVAMPYNVISGTRYLVRIGLNGFANSTNSEYITELHPRTAVGFTMDGKMILCVVDGRSSISAGVTLKQLADIMIEAGAWYALELDGGGSSAMWYGDKIVNVVSDGAERPVVNHLIIYEEAGMNGTAKEALGNTSTIRSQPSRYGTDTGKRIDAYSTIDFVQVVDVEIKGTADKSGDKWLKLTDGNYVNHILGGLYYYQILSQPSDPSPEPEPEPPTLPEIPYTITLGDDVTYIKQTFSGTLKPK
jgi:GH25 family lysozyme M1 (1,4-beta-N-acetylmuramidase)